MVSRFACWYCISLCWECVCREWAVWHVECVCSVWHVYLWSFVLLGRGSALMVLELVIVRVGENACAFWLFRGQRLASMGPAS